MGRRREQFAGVSEVSAAEQALLGQAAREMYVGPEFGLCNLDAPSEFDKHVLSLFDSIEANGDDIDTKIENLRAYLKSGGSRVSTARRSREVGWRLGPTSKRPRVRSHLSPPLSLIPRRTISALLAI